MISKALLQSATHQTLILWMICLGLVIFVTFFICLLIWTSRGANTPLYQAMSLIPLEDSDSITNIARSFRNGVSS